MCEPSARDSHAMRSRHWAQRINREQCIGRGTSTNAYPNPIVYQHYECCVYGITVRVAEGSSFLNGSLSLQRWECDWSSSSFHHFRPHCPSGSTTIRTLPSTSCMLLYIRSTHNAVKELDWVVVRGRAASYLMRAFIDRPLHGGPGSLSWWWVCDKWLTLIPVNCYICLVLFSLF